MEQFPVRSRQRLVWLQPKASESEFHLTAQEALLGTLAFRSASGSLAMAETAHGAWMFKRVGFFRPRVTIRRPEDDQTIADYRPGAGGLGTLTFADGPAVRWAGNAPGTTWTFEDAGGLPLMRFRQGIDTGGLSNPFKVQVTVDVEAFSAITPLLAALGMYLIVLNQADAFGAALAGSAG